MWVLLVIGILLLVWASIFNIRHRDDIRAAMGITAVLILLISLAQKMPH